MGTNVRQARKVNFVNIPQELKLNASFCVWKLEKRNGKPTKVPYDPKNGQLARTNDPSTFSDFGTAMKVYAMGGWDGIGFRVSEGIGAIDIDDCIRDDGSLNDPQPGHGLRAHHDALPDPGRRAEDRHHLRGAARRRCEADFLRPVSLSTKVVSSAPDLHPLTNPTLSNRPLYQSWG